MSHHLAEYVDLLVHQAAEGHLELSELLASPPAEQRAVLRDLVLQGHRTGVSAEIAAAWGLDAPVGWKAVAAVDGRLPQELHDDDATISGISAREILVPADQDDADIQARSGKQVVIGPPQPWYQARDALAWVRAGADLLARGTIRDERPVVPCQDLAVHLMTVANPLLAAMMVSKHFGELESLPLTRRLRIAEFVLAWLERGQPVSTLAREQGIPPQTAHSRMQVARTLLGTALDDPDERLELLIALRVSIPRWRTEARGVSAPSETPGR